MIDWLYTLPELLLIFIPATVLALLLIGLSWLVRRIPRFRLDDAHVDFVMRIEITVFSMASLVLVFTLIQADANYRRADDLVSKEASHVDQLDRLMARYGEARVAELRPLLRDYTRSIIQQEWPTMLKSGEGSEDTTRLFAALSHRILAVEPSTSRQSLIVAEMLKALDSTTEGRTARINAVTLGLPLLYWEVVAFALLMLISVASFAATNGFRTLVLAGQLTLLGALVGFVFIMDRPFYGQHALDSNDFERALARMAQRAE